VECATINGGIDMDGGALTVCNSHINGGVEANIAPPSRSSSSVIIGENGEPADPDEVLCAPSTINGGVRLEHVQGAAGCGRCRARAAIERFRDDPDGLIDKIDVGAARTDRNQP
jgi:hypothetical protein